MIDRTSATMSTMESDLVALAAAVLALGVTGAAATLVPAFGAARLHPTVALRGN